MVSPLAHASAGAPGRFLVAALLLGVLTAGCATTSRPFSGMGNAAGSFTLAGRQVPLPAGDWHVAARRAYKSRLGVPMADAVLIRGDHHRVDGVVLITTNQRAGGKRGWRRAAFCDAAKPVNREIHANRTGGAQDCWALRHGPTGLHDPADPALAKLIALLYLVLLVIELSPLKPSKFSAAIQYGLTLVLDFGDRGIPPLPHLAKSLTQRLR